ncbi:lipid II:glycine glycyltransferase FemX [Thermogemmatispora sp.]|uniref:lipid II:glycine glycyltransferase FemX n=1 Tax=Thermogemmatispora sp. TaxID=1968838 RepID=UPI001E084929|nr:GNAT family N-acetyltransferase [Thermogemmatispora sp.]MBX5451417.1 GNAT family N-acetyltransferase [Thermogemmatispora sp.]
MMLHATRLLTQEWSPALAKEASETFYLLPEWLELISRLYGYKLFPLGVCNEAGQLCGFLPLCLVQNRPGSQRLVAFPFSDYCPLLAERPEHARSLVDQALALAAEYKADCLELRCGPNQWLQAHSDFVISDLYVRWVLPLAGDAQAMWSQLRKPVQRQIRKATQLGVQVRLAERREEMLSYYQLHLRTRCKKHGLPAQPKRFFLELWDTFAASGRLRLWLAEYRGKPIAGMIFLVAGGLVRYAYGASHERYLPLAPNNLLMWQAIKQACDERFRALDLGRTACANQGLMEFKRRWGAEKLPLPYYYYPRQAGPVSTSEESRLYRWLTGCWRWLPLPISGPLGGFLYRYLG